MLIVKVKSGESIEKALKIFKRKVNSTKLINELRDRSEYVKPSVRRRQNHKKAVYKQKMQLENDK